MKKLRGFQGTLVCTLCGKENRINPGDVSDEGIIKCKHCRGAFTLPDEAKQEIEKAFRHLSKTAKKVSEKFRRKI